MGAILSRADDFTIEFKYITGIPWFRYFAAFPVVHPDSRWFPWVFRERLLLNSSFIRGLHPQVRGPPETALTFFRPSRNPTRSPDFRLEQNNTKSSQSIKEENHVSAHST